MTSPINQESFSKDLSKMLQSLKKEGLASKVRQGYKGTGTKSNRRQVWVDFEKPTKPLDVEHKTWQGSTSVDIWIEGRSVRIGGVIPFVSSVDGILKRNPSISIGDLSPSAVFAWIVEQLNSRF
jgi:hypothetical protein